MQLAELPRAHPVIFDSDKKQRFGISNNGEFVDNVYREQDPSKLVGRLIGRNQVTTNAKKVYTTADIVCETYLHKKGSWMQNWKRRYFVLRKDIRSICYYDNRENLTLLGSIPLDSETVITPVPPKDANGFEHCISMKAEGEDGSGATNTLIRFDNAETLKSWVLDIRNEALNLRIADDEQQNWWSATFDKIDAVEIKSNAVRRENAGSERSSVKPSPVPQQRRSSQIPPVSPSVNTGGSGGGGGGGNGSTPNSGNSTPYDPNQPRPSHAGEEAVIAAMMSNMKINNSAGGAGGGSAGAGASSGSGGNSNNVSGKKVRANSAAPDEDSDVDSDNEDAASPGQLQKQNSSGTTFSIPGSPNSPRRPHAGSYHNLGPSANAAAHAAGATRRPGGMASFGGAAANAGEKRKFKLLKPEKPPGPPPFDSPTAVKFETPDGTLRGLQVSLKLCNVCAYQDRIFVVLFGNMPTNSATSPGLNSPGGASFTPNSSEKVAGTVSGMHDIQTVFGSTGSKWTQISRTELRSVDDKPVYGENYVSDYRIHFSILQDNIPDNCKEIRFVVYRQENEMNYKEPSKASNLNMQLEMAKCIIPKRMFDNNPLLKVSMQVKIEIPMDIAVPLFKEAQVILGVARMSSRSLFQQRAEISKALKIQPYSEIMYTFPTTTGKTLSLEQLYASKYSISVAQALLNMWQLERNEYIFETVDKLRNELSTINDGTDSTTSVNKRTSTNATAQAIVAMAAAQAAHNNAHSMNSSTHGTTDTTINRIEHLLTSINTIEDFQQASLETTALVLENCSKMENLTDLVSNVIEGSVGGAFLRRSTWKKYTAWQYSATNLNFHLLTTKHYSFAECMAAGGVGSTDTGVEDGVTGIHITPTITMGVPAAHELKFSDGGLRRLFSEIPEPDQKLRWINAIQAPTMDLLNLMIMKSPREAHSLFGAKFNISSSDDIAHVLKRKMEIAHRIDICASQALCSAVSVVRTIVLLACKFGGRYMDTLARSLRIGFIVMFQSMLSTQGAELGMIEDLDIAALWLSLVTVRLVVKEDSTDDAESDTDDRDDYVKENAFIGKGDGVVCRRDKGGRLIVEIEITEEEGVTVLEAHRNMSGFPYHSTTPRDYPGSPLMFSHSPTTKTCSIDAQYVVYATAELFGVAVSQGVNEMQTLANLSSSRDVLKQVEINNSAIARLDGYYANYKEALVYQLDQRKPDLLECLSPPIGLMSSSGSNSNISSMSATKAPLTNTNSANSSSPNNTSMYGGMKSRRNVPSGTFTSEPSIRPGSSSLMSTASSNNLHSSVSSAGSRRRKSVRESIDNSSLMNTVNTLANKVVSSNDRLMDQLKEAVALSAINPHDKHVDVLLRSSALCREMGGVTIILCKSGKDRTSMGVTLENTRALVEDVGVLNGQEVCQLMRFQGVRRMNVYANTGQAMFAFNQIQRIALPTCYRPPPGCHSGNVNS